MTGLNRRQSCLLAAIRKFGGEWTTGRAQLALHAVPAPKRTTARRDLDALHRAGLLHQRGSDTCRFYVLTSKGAA